MLSQKKVTVHLKHIKANDCITKNRIMRKTAISLLIVTLLAAVTPALLAAQGAWTNVTGHFSGADAAVSATAFDAAGNLYLGGAFSAVGDVATRLIAKYTPTTGKWSDVGGGVTERAIFDHIHAIIFDAAGNCYAAGQFESVGGVKVENVAKWDGKRWSPVGPGMVGKVFALAFDPAGNLYAGGLFSQAGGVTVNNVAKWDGSRWSALGSGMNKEVYALAFDAAGNLYAGGDFTKAGGVAANQIAQWDGHQWSPLGLGVNGGVDALAVSGTNLYAGGAFSAAGGESAYSIAKWDGTTWSALGAGMDGAVSALRVGADGVIFAGGSFTWAGEVSANHIAKWDGTTWSGVGTGVNDSVLSISLDTAGMLYVGGFFREAGGVNASRIAKWDGTHWTGLDTGVNGACIVARLDAAGTLYAGGYFTAIGNASAQHVAKWNGTAWSPLGSGLSKDIGTCYVMAFAFDPAGNLYAGGSFTTAGGETAYNIAKWNGTNWFPLGLGLNGSVSALAYVAGNLYAGGSFTIAGDVAASHVAKWDGLQWSALGPGFTPTTAVPNADVMGLAADTAGNLYAVGYFIRSGDLEVNHVAKWDGSAWSALGIGIDVNPLFVQAAACDPAGNLYVGGGFEHAGGLLVNCIAKWNGSEWSGLDSGVSGGGVNSLWFDSTGILYVGGSFSAAGGVAARNIAKWDGSAWSPLGSGVDLSVWTLVSRPGGDLYAGGYLTMAGGLLTPSLAKWNPNAISYMLAVIGGTGSGTYSVGARVFIQANTPPDGQTFGQWTGDVATVGDIHASFTSVLMPAADVQLAANYEPFAVLSISRSGPNVILSWPIVLTGYTLESAERVPGGTWTSVPGVSGNSVTVPIAGSAQFYRLERAGLP